MCPKYIKKFALNPPCSRPPLAPGQEADLTSLKRGEDYPDEWAKRQAKLAKQAREVLRKFNRDSAAAAPGVFVSRRNPWQRSLRVSQVLHLQCPHGQFLTLLLLLQNPQLLRISPQLLRPNPQHLCILPRAKGLQASLFPLELQLVPQLPQILQQDPLC